jgi:hypothetical protein
MIRRPNLDGARDTLALMPELTIEAPNTIAALGLVDRLSDSSFAVRPTAGAACRIRVASSEAALPLLLRVVHAWLDAYDLHTIELSVGERRYTLGGRVTRLPDAAPPDELPADVVLES